MGLAERLQRDWWRPRLTALTAALWPLSQLYRVLSALDRLHRARGALPLDVPVLVIGNLIVGGAGKTPTVIAISQALRARGWRPGIVSRGYGRRDDAVREVRPGSEPSEVGDEPLLMHLRTGLPVVVGRDRAAAARALRAAHPEVDLLISDDGLQHRRLARDVELVVFDERGVGNGCLLPAGPLREPLPSRWPAHRLVAYNAAAPSTPADGWTVLRRLAGAAPLDAWWQGAPPQRALLSTLRGRRLVAAAGMAHPRRFFDMLAAEGLRVDPLPLPDHHRFATLPWPRDTSDVIVTEKDAVKLRPERVGNVRVWVVTLDLQPPAGLVDRLDALLRAARARRGNDLPAP